MTKVKDFPEMGHEIVFVRNTHDENGEFLGIESPPVRGLGVHALDPVAGMTLHMFWDAHVVYNRENPGDLSLSFDDKDNTTTIIALMEDLVAMVRAGVVRVVKV